MNITALFNFFAFCLHICMVGGANKRAACGVSKAHRQRFGFHFIKLVRAHVALYRQVVTAWLQILAQSQHGYTVAAKIAHHLDDRFVALADAVRL